MIIDQKILDELTEQAKASPRLRMNYDLRNTPDDKSQRILNAVEPGTVLPIHRHRNTSETVICVRGHFEEYFYDDNGTLAETIDMQPGGVILNVPAGQWHTIKSFESGTVLFECKNGAWEPLKEEDVLTIKPKLLHDRVVNFIDQNYEAVIDNGLMDDILIREYKANVSKLEALHLLPPPEQDRLIQWIDYMLKQMVDCAKGNLAAGNPKPVFKAFLEMMKVY